MRLRSWWAALFIIMFCSMISGDVNDKNDWMRFGEKSVSLLNSGKIIPWKPCRNGKRGNTTARASSWMLVIQMVQTSALVFAWPGVFAGGYSKAWPRSPKCQSRVCPRSPQQCLGAQHSVVTMKRFAPGPELGWFHVCARNWDTGF